MRPDTTLIPRLERTRAGGWSTNASRVQGRTMRLEAWTFGALLAQLWREAYSPKAIRRRARWRRFYRSGLPRDVWEILHGRLDR